MSDRQKDSQLLIGLIVILFLSTSVILCIRQYPSTFSDFSEGESRSSEKQNRFITSYTTHAPIVITSDADFAAQGFPGIGIPDIPYEISGYNITSTGVCISIEHTTKYFVIEDCLLKGDKSSDGIVFFNVTNGKIRNTTITETYRPVNTGGWVSENHSIVNNTMTNNVHGPTFHQSSSIIVANNTFSNNDFCGVIVGSFSTHCTIENNSIYGNDWYGVYLDGSSYNTVENNIIFENDHGIYTHGSWNNTIVNNTISENLENGAYIHVSYNNTLVDNTISENIEDGVYFTGSQNNILESNIIHGNDYGIHFYTSTNNTVFGNTISGSTNLGVYLYDNSTHNQLFLNTISDNTNGNAFEAANVGLNYWNTTGMGNYWSDYSGIGIYHIDGGSSNDYHPFICPPDTDTPTIDHPIDLGYDEGTTGHAIIWTPNDAYPSHYVVYQNGSEIITDSWTGNSISVDVDGLSEGAYNYTIVVFDVTEKFVSDTVYVIVQEQTTTTTTPTTPTTTTSEPTTSTTPSTSETSPTSSSTIPEDGGSMMVLLGIGGAIGAVAIIVILVFMKGRK